MTINISLPEEQKNLRPRITVVGVGGAGGNAVNNMIHSNLEGVDFLVTNTDAQALSNSACERRVQLGLNSTRGLGAGMRPDIGKTAAEEATKEIESKLEGANMAFIAAGMGGGTGTGAAPVLAKLAREKGILTVGVVTKPFHFEGIQRMRLADQGIKDLEQYVDTLIIIPNQNLFRIANEKTTFSDAFKMADDVLYAGVRGVTDLMVMPGLINLDFSDVKTVMSEMGKAMMGTGEAQGENRAVAAAEAAIENPLIDDVSLRGARGLIINITGGKDLTLYEVDEAANRIREEVDVEANIIFGSTCDDRLEGLMRVSIVATGIDGDFAINQKPKEQNSIKLDNSVYQNNINNISNATQTASFSNKVEHHILQNNSNTLQNDENNSLDNVESNEETIIEESSSNGLEFENFDINKDGLEDQKIENTHQKEQSENNLSNDSNISTNNNTEQLSESNVRRISLFDIEDEQPKEAKNDSGKKEPFLSEINNSDDNIVEKSDSIGDFIDEENQAIQQNEEDISQEEELLDVPTFLRRQAN